MYVSGSGAGVLPLPHVWYGSSIRVGGSADTKLPSKRERWEAAAVIATLKRSWGWDESPFIRVMFADGREHLLNPVFDAGSWWVEDPLAGS